ncbi:MAG: PAS domain S-box protein [Parvibaculum sp.]
MLPDTRLLEALPVAIYTTDAEGYITFFNSAAAAFWGHRPELGVAQWCGSRRLFWPDGRPMSHDECPMAVTLREGRAVCDSETIAERPDGSRVPFIPHPTLLTDDSGRITGAINLLVDITDRKHAELERARLAAIVSSSDDAIVSKTLEGRITSWNAAAARIFGYEAAEMIGQPITRIIPGELQAEEKDILAKIRRGQRVPHYDTMRLRRDGSRVNVSLTISPLLDSTGRVIGASKIARDITGRKQGEKLQRLLFNELNHRVKNTLSMIQAIANQSLLRSANPGDFVTSFNGRIQALARAHELLVQEKMTGADVAGVVREQVLLGEAEGTRIFCLGPVVKLDPQVTIQLALVLHELATNARKYGALSVSAGRLSINWAMDIEAGRRLHLEWKESGVPNMTAPASHGFGSILIHRTLQANGGEAAIHYGANGLTCKIDLPLPAEEPDRRPLDAFAAKEGRPRPELGDTAAQDLRGRRILLIEDEPLVAMDTEEQLRSAGCTIVGPAASVREARDLIAEAEFDAALVDANLGGAPVGELAAALTRKGIPFAFATGYGREALPQGFREAPVLTKPFSRAMLLVQVEALLRAGAVETGVVPLRPGTTRACGNLPADE